MIITFTTSALFCSLGSFLHSWLEKALYPYCLPWIGSNIFYPSSWQVHVSDNVYNTDGFMTTIVSPLTDQRKKIFSMDCEMASFQIHISVLLIVLNLNCIENESVSELVVSQSIQSKHACHTKKCALTFFSQVRLKYMYMYLSKMLNFGPWKH